MVLVLDDEAPVREMGRRFLEKWGYGCVEADGIDAALEALRTTTVVAAILDVRLPASIPVSTFSPPSASSTNSKPSRF
jgi:DNA-binding response OmpR family regulator